MAELTLPKVECIESTETYGRFVAEPVSRGLGIVLGNSLRRVLLGSLTGAAITWVEINGVSQEFMTIPDMKEDVMDLLLNVRGIRIRSLSSQPGKLKLNVKGEMEVKAGNIEASSDFEIVNPELHLATLGSPDAKLDIEFTVELDRGYLPARHHDGIGASMSIGPNLPLSVDAIFTPIRKANYTIEPSGSGEEASKEKLVLEVWTDGTLAPIEAVSQSASILIEQLSCFRELAKTMTEEGEELSWHRLIPPEQYNMPLEKLNLSTHTHNSLRRGGITTLGQILERGIDGMLSLAGFGAKSREEVEITLKALDLPLLDESKKAKKKKTKSKESISEGNDQ